MNLNFQLLKAFKNSVVDSKVLTNYNLFVNVIIHEATDILGYLQPEDCLWLSRRHLQQVVVMWLRTMWECCQSAAPASSEWQQSGGLRMLRHTPRLELGVWSPGDVTITVFIRLLHLHSPFPHFMFHFWLTWKYTVFHLSPIYFQNKQTTKIKSYI